MIWSLSWELKFSMWQRRVLDLRRVSKVKVSSSGIQLNDGSRGWMKWKVDFAATETQLFSMNKFVFAELLCDA